LAGFSRITTLPPSIDGSAVPGSLLLHGALEHAVHLLTVLLGHLQSRLGITLGLVGSVLCLNGNAAGFGSVGLCGFSGLTN